VIFFYKHKLQKINTVFINSYGFGHSVIESTIFYELFGFNGLCLSVGNKTNRNYYFKDIFEPYVLIHFWVPNVKSLILYQAIRKRVHEIIEISLQNSKLIKLILGKNLISMDRNILLQNAAKLKLIENYGMSEKKAIELLTEFHNDYKKANGNNHSSALQLIAQQKNDFTPNLPENLSKFNQKFNKYLVKIANKNEFSQVKICTLILRKSHKVWSGMGISGYEQIIEFLRRKEYIIFIVGDVEEFVNLRENPNFFGVYDHNDLHLNVKSFQLLSIFNSQFCIGDQSGAQTIVHFFGKKNLILNTLPVGYNQFNTVCLPQIWKDQKGQRASMRYHLNQLLHLSHPVKVSNNKIFTPSFNESSVMLEAVKNFVINFEQSKIEYIPHSKRIAHYEIVSKYTQNGGFAPEFFKNFNSHNTMTY
jgi:putative glycosyltransferase (TIGR04372 family)